jgi:hypothetical protein
MQAEAGIQMARGLPPACRRTRKAGAGAGPEVLRVMIGPERDQAWLWASVCSGLKRAEVAPPVVIHSLENETATGFPLALIGAAGHLTRPVVIVIGNAGQITSAAVLRGLDVLARHAPPNLHVHLAS